MPFAKNTNGGIGKVPASRTARSSPGRLDIGAVPASARGARVMGNGVGTSSGVTAFKGALGATGLLPTQNHIVSGGLKKSKKG